MRDYLSAIDDVAIWCRALNDDDVAEIWNGGTGASIGSLLGLEVPLEITDVEYDQVSDEFTLSWSAKTGQSYALFWSPDAEDWGADVNEEAVRRHPPK